ncbi:isopentenyl-diphosphate Delta-isomerase [Kitasatospora sp. MAP5-34]|uniref:isopentenyl-diphosphate Delta-isomerase n=1 Tax=Kitasatospora sp. MAP5-34 TaxID=3035102 RepID=UPI002476857C|nr:isopentenyl-diphosphate Delta-isomerase [Kitasatospora sp. MAP5-34]MDH6579695.1 isopentenyl-diphosphate delta-isomerase [Kitasatospora sp. MAP5-34]
MPESRSTSQTQSATQVGAGVGSGVDAGVDAGVGSGVDAGSGAELEILLELVDDEGVTIGTAEKLSAHQQPGRLHRAFSVFLFDRQGRLLLQRRALGKYHSPGVWSNTCCGHPYPGEAPFVAAARRTTEELGAAPALLCEAGTVRYDLPDEASGLIEREWNHLFVGLVTAPLDPDPSEVDDTLFVTADELRALEAERPFSVWFRTVFEAALPGIREIAGRDW